MPNFDNNLLVLITNCNLRVFPSMQKRLTKFITLFMKSEKHNIFVTGNKNISAKFEAAHKLISLLALQKDNDLKPMKIWAISIEEQIDPFMAPLTAVKENIHRVVMVWDEWELTATPCTGFTTSGINCFVRRWELLTRENKFPKTLKKHVLKFLINIQSISKMHFQKLP